MAVLTVNHTEEVIELHNKLRELQREWIKQVNSGDYGRAGITLIEINTIYFNIEMLYRMGVM
jgi:hypothetical protein